MSEAVVAAIAEVEGVDPTGLDVVLYDCIDPQAPNDQADHAGTAWEFQFDADGRTVTVDGDGTIVVDGHLFRR